MDQLDALMNNLLTIGGKKWYWTQLIDLICLLQVVAFQLFHHLNPLKKISQLEFLRNLVHKYATAERNKPRLNSSNPRIVLRDSNGHFLTSATQGRCKVCQKNCRMICKKCHVRLHQQCYRLHHDE